MRCPQAHRLLSAYLDQELPAREREAIETHLHHCRTCAGELQALTATRELLRQAPRFTAPAGFSQRLLANLEPAPPRFRWAPFTVRFAEAAVLLLMIALGVVSGRLLTPADESAGPGVALLSLDLFDPVPPDSLGGAYLAMTEVGNEE